MRDGLVQRDAAKPPPRQRVADLAAQALVAELVAVFQVHKAKQGRDRDRGAAQPGVEVLPPGCEEAFVVEVGVDAGQLGGEAFGLVGQERVPGGKRRGGDAKHRDLLHSDNGVIRPQPASHLSAFPQLSGYFNPEFFIAK